MKHARVMLAMIVAVAAGVVFAQVRETVNVNVIEVPVTVVDGSGNPIRGLTIDNFELLDNGSKRPITSFDKIDFASPESMKGASPLNPAARRNFMLLFDLSNASPKALTRSQEAARSFVADSVQQRDLVAVGTIEADRGFRLLTAFTTDRQLVEAAISDPEQFKGSDPLQIASLVGNVELVSPRESAASGGGGLRNGGAAAQEEMIERQQKMQHANAQYVRAQAEKEIEGLGALAKTLRAVPGRKQIVFLSEGFDPKFVQGRDARSMSEQQQENESILSGESYKVDTDARYGTSSSLTLLDRMAQTFRGSDVVLHAIDIQGVRAENDAAQGARINSNEGLYLLANPTGGEVFKNANEIKTNFQRLLRQQEVVYVLGFQAGTQKPGAYHNLKVRLVNVPGGHASYRTGYYEAGTETPQERVLSNAEIIVNDIPQSDVTLNAFAAAFPNKDGNAQVPVILELDGSGLLKDFRGSQLPLEIYIYAFDQDGVVRDRLYQKLGLDLKKVGDRLRSGGLKYYGTLSLPPGTYAVKSLVRTGETERRGFGRADIVVPKANEIGVSNPVPIDESPKAVLVKGNSHATTAAPPFQLNGEQFIPAAAAKKNGGPQKLVVFVHGATAEELTWETTPKTKYLGQAKGVDGTALVLEIDPSQSNVASVDITVHKKGVATAQKTSVPIVQ